MRYYIAILTLVALACFSCKKNTKSKSPVIKFESLTPDSVIEKNIADTVDVFIKITDAEGDFSSDLPSAIHLIDKNIGPKYDLPFPKNTNKSIDPSQGMDADCRIRLSAFAYFATRPDHPFEDTSMLELYVTDLAGNESNHITLPNIRIKKP